MALCEVHPPQELAQCSSTNKSGIMVSRRTFSKGLAKFRALLEIQTEKLNDPTLPDQPTEKQARVQQKWDYLSSLIDVSERSLLVLRDVEESMKETDWVIVYTTCRRNGAMEVLKYLPIESLVITPDETTERPEPKKHAYCLNAEALAKLMRHHGFTQ